MTQHTQSSTEGLPRIFSQKKLLRPPSQTGERDRTEQIGLRRPRSTSDLQSARKALQSANTSKAVKLQATTVVYLRKIQTLQKQDYVLGRQIQQAKGEIEELRVKRKGGQDPIASTVSSRCSTVLVREGPKGKMDVLRKKIDRENDKIKKIMGEIDKSRKQIATIKKLNQDLDKQLQIWTKRAQNEYGTSIELEQKVAFRNAEVQQRKLDQIHNKAHLIKDYDQILRRLDSQLGSTNEKKLDVPSHFYLTDVNPVIIKNNEKNLKILPHQSRRVGTQVTHLHEKAKLWHEQTQTIKTKMGVQNWQDVENKIQEQHQQNFHQYNFLNQRYDHLEQLRARNEELQNRKKEMREKYVESGPSREEQEKESLVKKIAIEIQQEDKCKGEIGQINEIFMRLKDFVTTIGFKTGLDLNIQGQVTESNMGIWLEQVLKVTKRKSSLVQEPI